MLYIKKITIIIISTAEPNKYYLSENKYKKKFENNKIKQNKEKSEKTDRF